MKTKIFIIFSFLPVLLLGQKINHFDHLVSKWNVARTYTAANQQNPNFAATTTTIFGYQGDTLINNEQWLKLYATKDSLFQNNLVYQGLTRSENNRVLYLDATNQLDTLYDFNLNVGDSVLFNLFGDYPEKLPVTSIDSIQLNGEFYKRFKFAEPSIIAFDELNEVWIEGIGSIHGPLFPNFPVKFSQEMPDSMLLTCTTFDNLLVYQNSSYSDCYINIVLGLETPEAINFSLVGENKIWSEVNCINFGPCETHFYKFQGDTILSANSYKKLYTSSDSLHSSWYIIGAMREDSAQKVFFSDLTEEYLLYDFSLSKGETLYADFRGCQFEMTLDNIDSIVLLNGEIRKRYNFSNWTTDTWIEGIGSINGLINVGLQMCSFDIYSQLNCFTENDLLKLQNSDFTSCYFSSVGLTKDISIEKITLSPNPFITAAILKTPSYMANCVLRIYSVSGKLLRTYSNLSGKQFLIERGDLNPGLYFIQLKDANNIKRICKMIISN